MGLITNTYDLRKPISLKDRWFHYWCFKAKKQSLAYHLAAVQFCWFTGCNQLLVLASSVIELVEPPFRVYSQDGSDLWKNPR